MVEQFSATNSCHVSVRLEIDVCTPLSTSSIHSSRREARAAVDAEGAVWWMDTDTNASDGHAECGYKG